MKCPHCTVAFHDNEKLHPLDNDCMGYWGIGIQRCSACQRLIFRLFATSRYYATSDNWDDESYSRIVHPHATGRNPLPPEVPPEFGDDYREAALVLADSPKASAALSRRCLQHILREKAGVTSRTLHEEIEAVIKSNQLPSDISEMLHTVREVGNFAAHPMKSQQTGEILHVEPNEAEWNLDVVEALFDFYFVAPAKNAARKAAMNQKLNQAGKPPMK